MQVHDGGQLLIRPLAAGDRAAVADLVRSVDPEDWLLQYLAPLLTGPGPDGAGGYAAVLPGGRLAGVCVLQFVRPGEAYLSGLRIAPDLRNRGVGTRFSREMLVLAARLGGRQAWLLSARDNLPAHRVVARLGYARVAEWQVWVEPALVAPPPGSPPVRRATAGDGPAVAAWLRRHPLAGEEAVAAPGSVWSVAPVQPADFTAWLKAGHLAVAGATAVGGLMAWDWGAGNPPELRIRYLRGTVPAVGALLAWAAARRRRRARAEMGMGLPGPQAALAAPWVSSAREHFRGFAFMRPLEDLQPGRENGSQNTPG